MLKIIHTGDLHLDSPFSNLDPHRAEVRRGELRSTFTSMLFHARTCEADMILITGDFFDAEFVTRETLALIKSEFAKVKCPIVISPGNHDSVSDSAVWREGIFPENTYIFTKEELSYFDFPDLGVRVWGWAFENRSMSTCPLVGRRADEDDATGERINLLCAHGDINSASSYCPVKLSDVVDFGADYAAFGHVHNPAEYTERIAYCGCLEGRAFDETGLKGIVEAVVTSEGGRKKTAYRRVPIAKRRYETGSLSVSGATTNVELKEKIDAYLVQQGYGDKTLLTLTLTGEVESSLVVNRAALESDCTRLFCLHIEDATRPAMGAEELRRDPTVRGEFYRLLEKKLKSEDPAESALAADALRVGLAALAGEAVSEI